MNSHYYLATTYDSGAYNSSTYNGDPTTTIGVNTSNTASNSGGTLANTGTAVDVFIAIAIIVLLLAIIIRFWRRSTKQIAASPSTPAQPKKQTKGYGAGGF